MKKRLVRNKNNAILAGVCSGLGDYFNLSPWIFRIIFIVPVLPFILTAWASLISIGIYAILAIVLPGKEQLDDREIIEVDYEIIDDDDEIDDDNSFGDQ